MMRGGIKSEQQGKVFVHLAYIDDSDSRQKACEWQVMSAVLIEDKSFKLAEMGISGIAEDLLPEERKERFEEFHASELYGGYGVFEGIDQGARFEAIRRLLGLFRIFDLSVIYGAVNMEHLRATPYGSADPADIAFRTCLKGVDSWVDKRIEARALVAADDKPREGEIDPIFRPLLDGFLEELVLVVVDECDPKMKSTLQKSFRQFRGDRKARTDMAITPFHDDMYFGGSRYSIGIQLADLCSYFICRHLQGDESVEGFYNWIDPHIKFFEIYPPLSGVL
jgi:hypothetical protein